MTAVIHRFRYPWATRYHGSDDPIECEDGDALKLLAECMENQSDRAAYVDTLVQQEDGVTWIAEDWTDRVLKWEADRIAEQRERWRLREWHERRTV